MIWEIDPTHSQVSFSIRVMGVSTTKGRFNALRGQLSLDEQNPASSWVEAEVGAASIDTHNRLRDAHLRSAAFFAVKQYPTIVFESTNVGHVSGQDYKVTGNLTLLGVTKPVIFDVTYHGQRTMMDARTGLTAKARINRHDFGLGQGMAVQFAASELATIEIDLEAVHTSAQARDPRQHNHQQGQACQGEGRNSPNQELLR
jgi:polyisoprenoid-binding protein YceI